MSMLTVNTVPCCTPSHLARRILHTLRFTLLALLLSGLLLPGRTGYAQNTPVVQMGEFSIGGHTGSAVLCNRSSSPMRVSLVSWKCRAHASPAHAPGVEPTQVMFDYVQTVLAPGACVTLKCAAAFVSLSDRLLLRQLHPDLREPLQWHAPGNPRRRWHVVHYPRRPVSRPGGTHDGRRSIFTDTGTRVTHGFELHCDATANNRLEINWAQSKFHLDTLLSAGCDYDAATNTYVIFGTGTGKYNGVSGATIFFRFTDAAEPGKGADYARYVIWDPTGNVVLDAGGLLNSGNHQWHTH